MSYFFSSTYAYEWVLLIFLSLTLQLQNKTRFKKKLNMHYLYFKDNYNLLSENSIAGFKNSQIFLKEDKQSRI